MDASPEVTPHTTIEYRIIATSVAGNGYSDWNQITTKSSSEQNTLSFFRKTTELNCELTHVLFAPGPGGVQSPFVTVLSSTSMEVSWEPPIRPNGELDYYVVKLPSPRLEVRNTSQRSVTVHDLVPNTLYFVTVTACTRSEFNTRVQQEETCLRILPHANCCTYIVQTEDVRRASRPR